MALIKKEETLTLLIKVPRKLHDEVDAVRAAAKKLNAVYDPTPRLIKALEKDLAAARKEIESAQKLAKESTVE